MSSETEREAAHVFLKAHADWLADKWSMSPEGRRYRAEFERHVAALAAHPAEPPRTVTGDEDLLAAVRALVFAARTSGGSAGRDEAMCAALDRVEALLVTEPVTGDGAEELPQLDPSMATFHREGYPTDYVMRFAKAYAAAAVAQTVKGQGAKPLAAALTEQPHSWLIEWCNRDGIVRCVFHGHNAIADYRPFDADAKSTPLYRARAASQP